jgi:hypothetical protein
MTSLERQSTNVLKAVLDTPDIFLNRADIAKRLGQSKVQIQLILTLDYLVLSGQLEARTMPTYAPSKYRNEYRAKQPQIA